MKTTLSQLFLLAALIAQPALAEVDVRFLQPDHYTDVGEQREATRIFLEIEQYLIALGARYLPPGQRLAVEVLDVDLAGRVEMVGRRLDLVRVLRGKADAPLLRLRYVLYAGEQPLAQGEEALTDMMYLDRPGSVGADEPLFYEKRLLLDWFRARFGAPPAKD